MFTLIIFNHMRLLKLFIVLIVVCICRSATAQIPNTWLQKANLPDTGRAFPFAFSIGNKGYVGGGFNINGYYKDFWEYDPATDTWTKKNDLPFGKRAFGISFSFNGKGYIGLGIDSGNIYPTDFWEYDPIQDTWLQKANFPGIGRYGAASFIIDSVGYLGTGYSAVGFPMDDFWAYNIKADTWAQKANYGGGQMYGATAFASTTKGYILTGSYNSQATLTQNVWEYDSKTNLWIKKKDFPGTARISAIGLNVSGHFYLGGGSVTDNSPLGITNTNDFWEYFPDYDAWIMKDSMPIASNGMASFAINDKGYFCNGYNWDKSLYFKTTYEYTIDTIKYTAISPINSSIIPTTNEIIIYPNPTTIQLAVRSSKLELTKVEIIDLLGRKYDINCSLHFNQCLIDVSQLPIAVYLLKVSDKNGHQNLIKFIKE
ncbi:MAG: hypothetical protein RL708_1803 [Bacteroidota bacterium]|jgi:N-acetylneuraminic acid mutarotase